MTTKDLLGPDLVILAGIIHTMDSKDSTCTAIAISDGLVIARGDRLEILELATSRTQIRDFGEAAIIPGLIDAHNHLLATGIVLRQVRLYDCRSIADIQARVADAVVNAPTGAWILGRGWDESLLTEQRHPNRHDLDSVAPENPVVLHRVWNKLVANSLAMQIAGITKDSPDPPTDANYAGSFERDVNGAPTGLFRDRAKDLITSHIPEPTLDDRVNAIQIACNTYNSVGLTGVAEPGLYPTEIRAFHEAQRRGSLTVRTDMLMAAWGFGPGDEEPEIKSRLKSVGVQGGFGDRLLRLEGVKLMPDGGVGDRTARMFEPYLNEPANRGLWVVPPDVLHDSIRWVHELGFSMDIHTCGDEAQEVVIRAYAAAQTDNPKPWLRHRVHHAYFPTETALQLMSKHQFSAIVSNPFITNLGESFVISLGEERAATAMPMRTYLDSGVPLAGSSDSSVSDFNPWVGMHAATTRKTVTGRELGIDQSISIVEAMKMYTSGAAWATGREGWLGSLEPGKCADLVVLDSDPLTMPLDELPNVKPLATMLGGEFVFERS